MQSKFTPATRARIISALAEGNYARTTCHAVGIAEKTYYRWLQEGRDALAVLEEGGRALNPDEKAKVKFLADVDQAEASSEKRIVAKILELGDRTEDWKAFALILERRFPARWGRGVGANTVTVKTGDEAERGLEVKLSFSLPDVMTDDDPGRQSLEAA